MKSFKDYVAEAEQTIAEKAVSQQQQKFMGMVHAKQKGKKVKGASPELKKVAHTMGKKDVKDFASTKHRGLPKKVGEEQVNEIDVDSLNQLASHAVNTLGHGGSGLAAAAGGSAIGGAIAGTFKKGVDWYQKRKEEKREKERQQQGMNESVLNDDQGSTFDHIVDRFRHEIKVFQEGGELDEHLYDALYDYYTHSGEMPYGVAKARTGDPYNWIAYRLDQDLGLDEAVRPEDVPAFQRKQAGQNFPVSMAQVQDQTDKISDLATLRKMAGLPYKPPASIPVK